MKKGIKMYANGTGAAGYLQSPAETMADYDIMLAKVEQKANSNIGLPITALASQLLTQGISSGMLSPTPKAANGSSNATGTIEAEGGEVLEAPGGEPAELKGAKHEQGGVDVNVPQGTVIYSDRIKKDGKTMADRKKARESQKENLEKLLTHSDLAIKNTAQRTYDNLQKEEAEDLRTQELFDNFSNAHNGMFALGTGFGGIDFLNLLTGKPPLATDANNPETPSLSGAMVPGVSPEEGLAITEGTLPDYAPLTAKTLTTPATPGAVTRKAGVNPTGGDVVGLIGDLVSTFGPMKNTLANRAGDTPNVNSFKDFGKDALATNAQEMDLIGGTRDNALRRITDKAQSSKRSLRNSARGVNTMRALDLGVDANANEADSQVADQFAKEMMDILGQKSQLENVQDSAVMQGEQQRDLNDRQDRDNFFTQKAKDISTMGTGIQQTGKDINQILKNPVYLNLLNEMSKYFVVNSKGEFEAKPTT